MQNICAKRPPSYGRIARLPVRDPVTRQMEEERREDLVQLASELIADLNYHAPHIREGQVMTIGPAPYRRIDCDRRALAYVRARPRKGMVRVDITGLWKAPRRESRLCEQSSCGTATLFLRSREDKNEAIAFLLEVVEETRAYHARRAQEAPRSRAADREYREEHEYAEDPQLELPVTER
jgi:hypothetical protein